MTRTFVIYCHTHIATGRQYVGQTMRTMEVRWKRHVADAKLGHTRSPFHRAIAKYGPDAFLHRILETLPTVEEANAAEARWIEALGTVAPHGFNLDRGGHAVGGAHPDTRARMSVVQKARNAAMSPERRREIARKAIEAMTPEERSDKSRRANARQTAEQRRERMCKAAASMTAEEKSARGRKSQAALTPAERSEIARKRTAAMSPEQRSERVRKAHAGKTPEERSGVMRKANASRTPEQRSAAARKAHERLTPEQDAERLRKAWATRRQRHGPTGTSSNWWIDISPEKREEATRKMSAAARERERRKRQAARREGASP